MEVDLLKPICPRVWVAVEGEAGFWQNIVVENLPLYCSSCWRLGHSNEDCKKDSMAAMHRSQHARILGGANNPRPCNKDGIKMYVPMQNDDMGGRLKEVVEWVPFDGIAQQEALLPVDVVAPNHKHGVGS